MAEEEAEKEYNTREAIVTLRKRFQELITTLKDSLKSRLDASSNFCQGFCQVLVEHGGQWKPDEDPLPLLEMYSVAILNFTEATPSLSPECEHVSVVLEKLGLNCVDLLLSLSEQVPGALWEEFQSSVKLAHGILLENGNSQLHTLSAMAEESGVWTNTTLRSILSNETPDIETVHEFLALEGPILLDMRIKHLIKQNSFEKAARLAKTCAEFPEFGGKKNFKQIYLVCLCEIKSQEELMQEIAQVDCKDALDMICNLESDGDEKEAFGLCSVFLKRQLVQGDVYCAWELTLLWSKLLMRLESAQAFLDQCRQLVRLSGSVYHILLFIKVIQSEVEEGGLLVCIEMCIRALQMGTSGNEDSRSTICKTISCLLPTDLEVKRACQLTEFLLKPTVDSYYAVETIFNEPDQKLEEENLPVPNSLRCDLLLALKTQWPFDPEFWDWKTLKRNCLKLMGEEASIVSSIDELNDSEDLEVDDEEEKGFKDLDFFFKPTAEVKEIEAERQKKREIKKLRAKGFVSARFRNWQAYMQYCVLCDKEFLGHRIVKHALKHVQDGIFRCPICAENFETRAVLEPHVASHVKQSSKERLAAMKASKKMPNSSKSAMTEGNILKDKSVVKVKPEAKVCASSVNSSDANCSSAGTVTVHPSKQRHAGRESENTEDCSCPVSSCQKVFKYFRNLVAHVKAHKNDNEAKRFLEIQCQKAVCQYCRRQFVNVTHLNDHLQMHCGKKPYYCIQQGCKATFLSHAELIMHRKVHAEFKAQCMFPNCERIFSEAYLLYDHEAQHYIMFTCKSTNCGKIFYSLSQLNLHQKDHVKEEVPTTIEDQSPKSKPPTPSSLVAEHQSKQVQEVPKESGPVKIKHSVESMLNSSPAPTVDPEHSASLKTKPSLTEMQSPTSGIPIIQPEQGSEVSKPSTSCPTSVKSPTCYPVTQPCYVKVEPIPINCQDAVFLNSAMGSESLAQALMQDKKLYSGAWSHSMEVGLKKEPANGPVITVQNKSPQAAHLPATGGNMVKTGVPHPSKTNLAPIGEDKNTHICPFETCTRNYSSSKSLSRHVKNVHSEAYEEWKLSKKYKRIANIAAKKPSSVKVQAQKNTSGLLPPQKNAGIRQLEYPVFSNSVPVSPQPFSAAFCSQLGNTQSETSYQTGLLQSEFTQPWHSPAGNNYNSDLSEHSHYHSFTSELNNLTTDLCSVDGSTISPMMNADSSVMNEAVSNSLRVLHALNGDQCDISQAEANEDPVFTQIGQNHSNTMTHNSNLSHSGILSEQRYPPYISIVSAEAHPAAIQPLDITNKALAIEEEDSLFSSDIKNLTPLTSPTCKEELELCSVSHFNNVGVPIAPTQGDFSSNPHEETKKAKRVRSSKRTKWPAIIKDGKVICCRCYREFSSTKSLGGHLSKRSQCKAFDEVDLTADLPTSFLDFLNDPDVSHVNQQTIPRNTKHDQDSESFISQHSQSNMFHNDQFPKTYGSTYDMKNGNPSSNLSETAQQASQKQSDSFSSDSFLQPSLSSTPTHCPNGTKVDTKKKELKDCSENFQNATPTINIDTTSIPAGVDGKVMEIQRALQRLDLVDADHKVDDRSFLHNFSCDKVSNNDQCATSKDNGENEEQQKPFKCEKDGCVYGAMTKEALFKHLYKIHNYTADMIKELKKNPDKLAPYSCHLCTKTFTRTTGLRIHYKNVHHMSREELVKLKIGRDAKKADKSTSETEDLGSSPINSHRNRSVSARNKPSLNTTSADVAVSKDSKGRRVDLANKCPEQDCVKQSIEGAMEREPAHGNSLNPGEVSDFSPLTVKTEYPMEELVSTLQPDHDPNVLYASVDSISEQVAGGSLLSTTTCSVNDAEGCPQAASPLAGKLSSEKMGKPKKTHPKVEADIQKREKLKKKPSLKVDTHDSSDVYRPYRCVHEGCVAAFSVQHNLILHYRSMHQTEQDAEPSAVASDEVDGAVHPLELKCQVQDCSKVLPKVTSLLKHYLLLHRFTVEKTSTLLSSTDVGTFQCDQSKCLASFTSHLTYIDHIKNDHKAIKVSEGGNFTSVDLTFKCEFEGCDRIYTTRSNLLRHLMKKHDATFETIIAKQDNLAAKKLKATGVNPNNGKENMANNKFKMKRKNAKKKDDKARNHWTSFGKLTLKSMDEASAMCTKKCPLQYPCMIKGCESVSSSERSIFKHYGIHGLIERYIEDQRSQFIFCKKYSRSRNKDASKSDGVSTETSEDEETDPDESDDENSVGNAQEHEPSTINPPEGKLLGDESSESTSMMLEMKRKRGRPRKSDPMAQFSSGRRPNLRNRAEDGFNHVIKVSESTTSNTTAHQEEQADGEVPLKHFSPLGLEQSFSKFLEDSSQSTQTLKRKTSESSWIETPSKKQRTLQQQTANIMCKGSNEFRNTRNESVVNFRNPLNLKSVKNVKIVMDKTFSNGADLLLKQLQQLQDMRPMVILKKWLYS